MKYISMLIEDLNLCKIIKIDPCVEYEVKNYQALFEKYCPWKDGDEVYISKEIPIEKASGWWSHRYALRQGAIGHVNDVRFDYDRNKFCAYFRVFETHYFNSDSGELTPMRIPEYSSFFLTEDYLKKLINENC